VPIDATVPQSPGWWMSRLSDKLIRRRKRIDVLARYYTGDPPLPEGAENARDAYAAFQRKARTNFAELIVEALRERCVISGFRTAAADDDNGDEDAWKRWRDAGLPIEMADTIESMFALGDGYIIVGKDAESGELIVTGEDPRQVVTEHDPRQQRKVIAALKLFHDDVAGPRLLRICTCRASCTSRSARQAAQRLAIIRWNSQSWEWVRRRMAAPAGYRSGSTTSCRSCAFATSAASASSRRTPTCSTALTTCCCSAWSSRPCRRSGSAPSRVISRTSTSDGNPIDYDELFAADPGALWRLPESVTCGSPGRST
jgi:hypothetical protein